MTLEKVTVGEGQFYIPSISQAKGKSSLSLTFLLSAIIISVSIFLASKMFISSLHLPHRGMAPSSFVATIVFICV